MTTIPALFLALISCGATPQGEVLDFGASWCGPCQRMHPIVERLQRQGLPIRKVDIDQEPGLAQKYRIQSVPQFVLVVNGREVRRITGVTDENTLRQLLSQIPKAPPATPPAVVQNDEGFQPVAAPAVAENQPAPPRKFAPLTPPANRKRSRVLPGPMVNTKPNRSAREKDPVFRAKPEDTLEISDEDDLRPSFDPMLASTRIRVSDGAGINYGSGTIIDSRLGRTLILTCGHLFRKIGADAVIEVDVFQGKRTQTFVGKPVKCDFEADVALLEIPTDARLSCARIAPPGFVLRKGAYVQSIGCGGGEDPTRQRLQVTALNRYRGPDNIECTGVPVQGRSGGGLFTAEGAIVGVCTAADPQDKRGLYAGLQPVHDLLDDCEVTHLSYAAPEPAKAAADVFAIDNAVAEPALEETRPTVAATPKPGAPSYAGTLDEEQLESVRAAASQAGEAEVICVIRPLKNSQAASRVVVLNRASPEFVRYLTSEVDTEGARKMTSLHVKAKAQASAKAPAEAEETWSAPVPAKKKSGELEPQRYRRAKRLVQPAAN